MLRIDWGNPRLPEEEILSLCPNDLYDFYASAADWDKSNLFFVLLNTLHIYEEKEDASRAGHLSYLIANYLFVALTPPGSYDLSMHYIKKAITWNPLPEYEQCCALMEKGN